MGNTKIQISEHKDIIQLYNDGVKIADIATKYGVQPQSVRKILKKYDIKIKSDSQKFHRLYDSEIIQYSLDGLSNRQIADIYGVDHNTISKILLGNGIDNARSRFHILNDESIVFDYINGKKVVDIENEYNIDYSTIFSILDKYNIPRRQEQFHIKHDEDIIQLYKIGYSTNEIAAIYDVDHNTIADIISKLYFIRSKSEQHRQYTINEHYFDEIDTPNKAYILGFLYADGTNNGSDTVSLSLQERDVGILQKIQREIGSNAPLNYREFNKININWSNQWRMCICNKHISDILSQYGMVRNKTFVVKYPKWLDDSLHSHFIRGMIDGDGCVNQKYVSLCGTYDICYTTGEILREKCGINYIIYRNQNIYDLRVYKKQDRINVLSFLYKDADLFLDRKHNEYLNFMNSINNTNQNNELAG